MCNALGGRKRLLNTLERAIIDSREPFCECWEPNSDPLEEKVALLTIEQYLQPISFINLTHPSTAGGDRFDEELSALGLAWEVLPQLH